MLKMRVQSFVDLKDVLQLVLKIETHALISSVTSGPVFLKNKLNFLIKYTKNIGQLIDNKSLLKKK